MDGLGQSSGNVLNISTRILHSMYLTYDLLVSLRTEIIIICYHRVRHVIRSYYVLMLGILEGIHAL